MCLICKPSKSRVVRYIALLIVGAILAGLAACEIVQEGLETRVAIQRIEYKFSKLPEAEKQLYLIGGW